MIEGEKYFTAASCGLTKTPSECNESYEFGADEISSLYKTRRDQIRAFMRTAKLPLTTKEEKARFFQAMKDACMVGAEEERSRCLRILAIPEVGQSIRCEIRSVPVLEVLGFEKGGD